MTRHRCASLLGITAALLAAGEPVAAQTNYEPRDLTRGVALPATLGVAGDYDATSVALNPGGLATLGGSSVAFVVTQLSGSRTLVGGGGWGLFLALPLHVGLPDGSRLTLSYGFGFQGVDSPASWLGPIPGAENQDGSYLQNSVAFGTSEFGIGYTIGNFFWTDTPQEASILTHHLGFAMRPSRFVAAGLTLRDVFEPVGRAPEEKFVRSYDSELMLRPTGDWRVELGGGALIGEDEHIDVRGRAVVRPISGVALFAQYESVARQFDDPSGSRSRDHRVMAGLTLDSIDSLLRRRNPSLSVSYGAITSSRSARNYAGSSILVRWSEEKYPAIVEPQRVEQHTFDDSVRDRQFVARLLRLRTIARSPEVAGVVLVLGTNNLGWGRTEELRSAVAHLRSAGKKVIAYLREGGMTQYYVASACDVILAHPSTSLQLTGVASEVVYIRDLLDKLGITFDSVEIAEYKSATEPLTQTGPSAADQEQRAAYLSDVVGHFAYQVASERRLKTETIRDLFTRASITPPQAMTLGLIDGIAHPDEINGTAEKLYGAKVRITEPNTRPQHPRQWRAPRIAIIYVDGDIVSGRSPANMLSPSASGDEIAEAIASARRSRTIEAIILRVNSPGGQVLPSERIAREVELTARVKPVIVSMGDVAASGGYMASAPANVIFAEPSTVTGSIGIYALKADVSQLMRKIGARPETLKVGEHADAGSIFRRWTPQEKWAVREELSYHYERFVSLVAAGRNLSDKQVDKIGRGRIWSGNRARSQGLVDRMGGVLDAVTEAQRRANISWCSELDVVHWPVPGSGFLGRLLGLKASSPAELLDRLPPTLRAFLGSVPAVLWWDRANLARLPWISPALVPPRP